MKRSTRVWLLFCFLWSLSFSTMGASVRRSSVAILDELDVDLSHKSQYEMKKQKSIDSLKRALTWKHSAFVHFNLLRKLYAQYASYQYDSAYVYAQKMNHLAHELHDINAQVEGQCNIVFCLLSAGLFNEASETLDSIDIHRASLASRKLYFTTASRCYFDMADFTHANPYMDRYIEKGCVYTDSLLQYLTRGSRDWLYAVGMKEMKLRHYDRCSMYFKQLLARKDVDNHMRAIVSSSLGWMSLYKKHDEEAIGYLAQAAICDNQSVTRETTALCTLARLLYQKGDIQRATEYVRQSLENANFYGARQRVIEVSGILPIIEQDRYSVMEGQRNALAMAAVVALLFVLALLVFTWFVRKQMKKLKQARNVIANRKAELEEMNGRLREVNTIKDEYIGQSFYANAEYINHVEKLYRTIDQKIAARQYHDLRLSLKESELIAERKSMFSDFDKTFLNLFPNFIERYNSLFVEGETKANDKQKSLTTEMRIFALIRLGITDSERIAKFLNYSIHTINTYKTRVKNKSWVDNDQFEARIMEI